MLYPRYTVGGAVYRCWQEVQARQQAAVQPNMKRSHYQHLIKTAKHRSWVVEIDIPTPPIVIDLTMDDDE